MRNRWTRTRIDYHSCVTIIISFFIVNVTWYWQLLRLTCFAARKKLLIYLGIFFSAETIIFVYVIMELTET